MVAPPAEVEVRDEEDDGAQQHQVCPMCGQARRSCVAEVQWRVVARVWLSMAPDTVVATSQAPLRHPFFFTFFLRPSQPPEDWEKIIWGWSNGYLPYIYTLIYVYHLQIPHAATSPTFTSHKIHHLPPTNVPPDI